MAEGLGKMITRGAPMCILSFLVIALLLAPSNPVGREAAPMPIGKLPNVALPMQSGAASGPSKVSPSSSGPGNVSWTLCLSDGQLLTGNAACPSNVLAPHSDAYDVGNGYVYVANTNYDNVTVINGATDSVIGSIAVGSDPWGVTYDIGNGYIYVANANSNNLTVINGTTDSVIGSIAVGSSPVAVGYDSRNGHLYVPDENTDNVTVINGTTDSVIASIAMGSYPDSVAYDSVNGYIYVTNFDSYNVSVINGATDSVIASIAVEVDPDALAYDAQNGYIYVDNAGSAAVSVINGTTDSVISTIGVLDRPVGEVYDSGNGYIYVTDRLSDNVSVINGATDSDIASIAAGVNTWAPTYDGRNGYIYVANEDSGSVSIITPSTPTYSANFSESGLTSGTSWSVTIANHTLSSTTSTIAFSEMNGTYPFTVGSVSGYTANVTAGSVKVNGAPVSTSIRFTPKLVLVSVTVAPSTDALKVGTYANFTATPSCTGGACSGITYSWSMNNTALGVLNVTSGPSVKFTASAKGVENLSVNATLSGHFAKSSSIITITPIPTLAYVSLTPLAVTVNVSGSKAFMATVECADGACPLGSNYSWSSNNSLGKLNVSTGPEVLFTANSTAGVVNLTVTAHLNGKTAANSSIITILKPSHPPNTYVVNFSESGLPSGTTWSIAMNTTTEYGTGTINFTEPNGTYSFSVGAVTGYAASPSSGMISVDGYAVSKPITFTTLPTGEYSLIFSEIGLPTGTNWSVTYFGVTRSSTASSIAYTEPNGTWTFTIGAVKGYTASPESGSITIRGAPQVYNISFTKSGKGEATYAVTFGESGLPSGTTWSVTLNGSTLSGAGSIVFTEPNGTYQFSIVAIAGYTESPSSGVVVVNGGPVSQAITFTSSQPKSKTNQSATLLGLPEDYGYILVGAIAAAALLLLVLYWTRRRDQDEPKGPPPASGKPAPASWVELPTPPKPPDTYMDGVSVATNIWDESAEPATAYGTYTVNPKEETELSEAVSGGGASPPGTADAGTSPQPTFDAYRPFSMKITPEGIQVEQVPKAAGTTRVVYAESAGTAVATSQPTSGPSSGDVYAVMRSLSLKPRSLDGIKLEAHLEDDALFAVLGALSKAKLIARGTQENSEAAIFVLTPLGRNIARLFIQGQGGKDERGATDTKK